MRVTLSRFLRWVFWFVGLAIVALFVTMLYLDSKDVESSRSNSAKQMELSGSTLTGYNNGKVSWQVVANSIWAGRSRTLYFADEIETGRIYNQKGELIIDDLVAQSIKVNSRAKTLTADKGVSALFIRDKNLSSISIFSDSLSYYHSTNRSKLIDNVRIVQDDVVIQPDGFVTVDHDQDQVKMEDGYVIDSDEFLVSGNKMIIELKRDRARLYDGVFGQRKPLSIHDATLDDRELQLRKMKTDFSTREMTYFNQKNQYEIRMTGNVNIKQKDKHIKGDRAYYNEKKGLYVVEGHIEFKSDNLKWVIDKHRKKEFNNPEAQESIGKPITMTGEKLIFNSKTQMFKMIGNVEIIQDDKTISCEKLEFNDESGWVDLAGNVVVERMGQERIQSNRIEVNIQNEEVRAGEGVETEFEI